MARLAIRGHATRGKDVIEILEMLGGKNIHHSWGVFKNRIYTIDEKTDEIIDVSEIYYSNYNLFTLEEFLEKFPYKVGDKVSILDGTEYVFTIKSMTWNTDRVVYKLKSINGIENDHDWLAGDLIHYTEQEEESMEVKETLVEIDLTREETKAEEIEVILGDYEFVLKNGKTYFVKKKPKYPKTYEECCNVIGCDSKMVLGTMPVRYNTLVKLEKLLICRDAYWKIAGEQMGLGKPWRPDWENKEDTKYCITKINNQVKLLTTDVFNYLLTFPTSEMGNAFKENFDGDIDACKEFL